MTQSRSDVDFLGGKYPKHVERSTGPFGWLGRCEIRHSLYDTSVVTDEPPAEAILSEYPEARRIVVAWRELRRGAAASVYRDHVYGRGPDQLEPGQTDTLDLLVQRSCWRMTDLADALRVEPSTATRSIQRLLKIGLAERKPHPDDGRVVMVSATPEGRDRHAGVARRRRQALVSILSTFSDTERQQLADLWEQFVQGLDKYTDDLCDWPNRNS